MFTERSAPGATDPSTPRLMPPEVERELRNLLGFRTRPNPVDVYMVIRDELARLQARP
jgi:hypothetical protein